MNAALTIQETPPAAVATDRAEGQSPEWDGARMFQKGTENAVQDAVTRCAIWGGELLKLKEFHGFVGSGGDHRAKPNGSGLPRTWPELCRTNINRSADSADNYIKGFKSLKNQIEKENDPVAVRLLSIQPSKLSPTDQDRLMHIVRSHVAGKTMKEILADFPRPDPKILTLEDQAKGGEATAKKQRENLPPDTLESHLRMLFDDLAGIRERAEKLPENKDFKAGLKLLALHDDPAGSVGLMDFRSKLDSLQDPLIAAINRILAAVDQTIDAKMSVAVKKPRKTPTRQRK
jgi:hypothetical protein